MAHQTDDPRCPKCSHPMQLLEITCAIPKYVEHDKRPADGASIDAKTAFPLEVHHCSNCRYVEFFAA